MQEHKKRKQHNMRQTKKARKDNIFLAITCRLVLF